MVFMLIRRWALFLCIALGAHTQAHAMFNPFPTPQTTFQIEMPQATVNAVSGTSFWRTFLTKVNWKNFAARLPGACIVGSAMATSSVSYNQQKTWWMKGLRVIGGCAAASTGGVFMELTAGLLATMGAPAVVGFGTGVVVAGLLTWGFNTVVEQAFASHANGVGKTTESSTQITANRGLLNVYNDEYLGSSVGNWDPNVRHPSSRWAAGYGVSTSTATYVGTDAVGGVTFAKYTPSATPCP